MVLRRDAGGAAAQTIAFASERAKALAAAGRGHFVATAGVVDMSPNASNVVPGRARIVFDIRGEDQALVHDFIAELDERTREVAEDCKVERRVWNLL
ncbi:Zn-dependent hydrolase, partial [Rhizobiaceae sp. 2RAB30]